MRLFACSVSSYLVSRLLKSNTVAIREPPGLLQVKARTKVEVKVKVEKERRYPLLFSS